MVFTHDDYRLYLKSVLAERVAKNPRYSLRAMAKSFAISSPLFSQICSGQRNLTLTNAVRISKKLDLSRRESDYFCSLVQYQTAKNPETKALLSEKLAQLRTPKKATDMSVDSFQSMSSWYDVAITELLRIKRFKPTPKAISQRLGISAAEAQAALERLQRLGVIAPTSEGGYARTQNAWVVQSKDKSTALQSFYRQMLDKASVSLTTQGTNERHFGSETIALDVSQIPEARRRMDEFLDDMAALFAKAENPTEVFYLGTQFFRLTRPEDS